MRLQNRTLEEVKKTWEQMNSQLKKNGVDMDLYDALYLAKELKRKKQQVICREMIKDFSISDLNYFIETVQKQLDEQDS